MPAYYHRRRATLSSSRNVNMCEGAKIVRVSPGLTTKFFPSSVHNKIADHNPPKWPPQRLTHDLWLDDLSPTGGGQSKQRVGKGLDGPLCPVRDLGDTSLGGFVLAAPLLMAVCAGQPSQCVARGRCGD